MQCGFRHLGALVKNTWTFQLCNMFGARWLAFEIKRRPFLHSWKIQVCQTRNSTLLTLCEHSWLMQWLACGIAGPTL